MDFFSGSFLFDIFALIHFIKENDSLTRYIPLTMNKYSGVIIYTFVWCMLNPLEHLYFYSCKQQNRQLDLVKLLRK